MDNVVLEDIKKHYAATHTTRNLRFVVAGNLPAPRRKLLEALFEDIELPEGTERLELPLERPTLLKKPLYIQNDTIENLYFYLDTFAHRRLDDPEFDALSLINTMLTETLYSRILGTARERGLVYSMGSGVSQSAHSSNWWFGAQVMPKNASKLFDIVLKEVEAVFNAEISQEDIASAKQYSLGRFQRSGQTVGGTASGYSNRYFFDEYINDYYKIPERIDAVTKEMIVAVSRDMFAENTWGLGCLGSSGEEFITQLHTHIKPLWNPQLIAPAV
jgi:predicted Zn-dependent peptidase